MFLKLLMLFNLIKIIITNLIQLEKILKIQIKNISVIYFNNKDQIVVIQCKD